jgi:hypothetical protein
MIWSHKDLGACKPIHLVPPEPSHISISRASNQLVAVGIMFRVPSFQLGIRHPNKLMSNSSVFLIHNALLADRITLPFGNEVDPEVVVNSAQGDTRDKSVLIMYNHACAILTSQSLLCNKSRRRSSQSLR